MKKKKEKNKNESLQNVDAISGYHCHTPFYHSSLCTYICIPTRYSYINLYFCGNNLVTNLYLNLNLNSIVVMVCGKNV